uniref:Uncharacterized protein n=1 Tax=Rhizophora mucronata TaxID=61149 RepID=A0A2P2LSE3_RHIMU
MNAQGSIDVILYCAFLGGKSCGWMDILCHRASPGLVEGNKKRNALHPYWILSLSSSQVGSIVRSFVLPL